jgi:hypothetical protein
MRRLRASGSETELFKKLCLATKTSKAGMMGLTTRVLWQEHHHIVKLVNNRFTVTAGYEVSFKFPHPDCIQCSIEIVVDHLANLWRVTPDLFRFAASDTTHFFSFYSAGRFLDIKPKLKVGCRGAI